MNKLFTLVSAAALSIGTVSLVYADLPDPGMDIVKGRTALLITDPQNDFLSPDGMAWGVVGKSVETNDTVENVENPFKAAKATAMSANLCTESHMRELKDQGFEVAVVADASDAAQVEEGDGFAVASINYRFIANSVWSTGEALVKMSGAE